MVLLKKIRSGWDMMKRILIVEDDIYISKMLCDLLGQHGYLLTVAYSGTEALLTFRQETYDLVLLDLMLPGKTGTQVLDEIRKQSSIPIIVLTAIDNKQSTVALLTSGANDYMIKPFDNEELLARIQVQFRSLTSPVLSSTTEFKDIVLDVEKYDAFIDQEPLALSKREFEILRCLIGNPKKVFTKNNLYESVWKDEFMGDDNTVNVHISKLRSKIAKKRPGVEYIQTVWGIGFKMN